MCGSLVPRLITSICVLQATLKAGVINLGTRLGGWSIIDLCRQVEHIIDNLGTISLFFTGGWSIIDLCRQVEHIIDKLGTISLFFTGGWSIIDIPGPTWNINSSDFLTQNLLGNPAFFSVGIDPDGEDSTRLLLQVCAGFN